MYELLGSQGVDGERWKRQARKEVDDRWLCTGFASLGSVNLGAPPKTSGLIHGVDSLLCAYIEQSTGISSGFLVRKRGGPNPDTDPSTLKLLAGLHRRA